VAAGAPDVNIPIPISPIYLGIGALLTLPTAILIFAGGLVNSFTQGYSASHALPGTTYRWVGGAAMTVAVLYSLVMYVVEGRRKAKADHEKSAARHESVMTAARADAGPRVGVPELTTFPDWQLRQSRGIKQLLWACIAAGTVLMLVMLGLLGAPPLALAVLGAVALVLAFLLSGLGGLLSLQVGASASPVSGTVFMGLLVLSVTALSIGLAGLAGVAILVPLVVATCVAICAANDSSQDYKTVQLTGFKVTDSFPGHLLGLLAGALVVPATLSMAHAAFTLGSPDLPCPQAGFFSTVLQSLFLQADIPWGPVGFGACLGVVAVIMDAVGRRRGLILSALAFAVGIYLTPAAGVGMMLGALARWLPKRKLGASTHEGVLIAAGLITGEAICQLVLGGLILSGVKLPGGDGDGGPGALSQIVGPILLVVILALIYRNNAKGRAAEGGGH
jgi:putative OPT family oligopeptide transporter